MIPNPDRVYLVRGATIARLEEELRRRTPLPSNASDSTYLGPRGFTLPRGGTGSATPPFEVSVQGDQIFVAPGIISAAHYFGEPFVPRSEEDGPRLDEFPAPSCGAFSTSEVTHVHLVFDCELDATPIEEAFVGGRINDAWIQLATVKLPYRTALGGGGRLWKFAVSIGRVGANGVGVLSLLNTNLQPSFIGPYSPFPPGSFVYAMPTITLFSPINTQI